MQIKVSTAKQELGDLCLLWHVLRLWRLQPQNSIRKTLLAKAMSYTGLWASPLPSVCCLGGAEIKMNFKTEGDESSCFPCPPPTTPIKATYRENFLFIRVRKWVGRSRICLGEVAV